MACSRLVDSREPGVHNYYMNLSELLESSLILPKAACTSKDEFISKLLDKIYSTGYEPPLPARDVLRIIQMREEIGGTMLPSGLSVPHARLKEYDDFILAIGTPGVPIIHQGIQLRLMTLMISSQSGGPLYLPVLAALTKITRDREYLSLLCNADTPEQFIDLVKERDVELT